MHKISLFLVLLSISFAACNSDKQKSNATVKNEMAQKPAAPILGFPKDTMIKLLNEATSVDYIFHNLPFSLSHDQDSDINQNISFIDVDKPLVHIPKGCKPDARKFFQIKGNIVYDIDVYISNGCMFYVFVDKANKPIYANYMTQSGINFYNNIIQQAAGMVPQQ
jgi:hypothetical protein